MTLWILFCRMSNEAATLFTFYARDREHAEQQATEILVEYPYERLDLKAYPGALSCIGVALLARLKRMSCSQ